MDEYRIMFKHREGKETRYTRENVCIFSMKSKEIFLFYSETFAQVFYKNLSRKLVLSEKWKKLIFSFGKNGIFFIIMTCPISR